MAKTINWVKNIIPHIQQLLKEYTYRPTARAIYYRLVSDGLIPNTQRDYKGYIQAKSAAHERDPYHSAYLDVYAFADSTRYIENISDQYWTQREYTDLYVDKLTNAGTHYFKDGFLPRWHNQPNYVEIMIEKDALRGVFKNVLLSKAEVIIAPEWFGGSREVRLVPNNGWTSKIYWRENIDRLRRYSLGYNGECAKEITLLYFGDYDPTGQRMFENIKRDLKQYGFDVERVALNKEQISDYSLDHLRNPDPDTMTKLRRDPNRDAFMANNNGELFQIELDALMKDPKQFTELVTSKVDGLFDNSIYEENLKEHTAEKITRIVDDRVYEEFNPRRRIMDGVTANMVLAIMSAHSDQMLRGLFED